MQKKNSGKITLHNDVSVMEKFKEIGSAKFMALSYKPFTQ